MPRGGRRSGAGRKPKSSVLALVTHARSHRGQDDLPPHAGPAALRVEPPPDLPTAERKIWDEWAPSAIAAGTLVAATIGAFVALCELEADRRELRARVVPQGAQPRLPAWDNELGVRREVRALALAVRAGLKDFCIAPFGKEVITDSRSLEQDDPLARFLRRQEDKA